MEKIVGIKFKNTSKVYYFAPEHPNAVYEVGQGVIVETAKGLEYGNVVFGIKEVDDDDVVKVHIHTNNPGYVIEEALKIGELINIKIDNIISDLLFITNQFLLVVFITSLFLFYHLLLLLFVCPRFSFHCSLQRPICVRHLFSFVLAFYQHLAFVAVACPYFAVDLDLVVADFGFAAVGLCFAVRSYLYFLCCLAVVVVDFVADYSAVAVDFVAAFVATFF